MAQRLEYGDGACCNLRVAADLVECIQEGYGLEGPVREAHEQVVQELLTSEECRWIIGDALRARAAREWEASLNYEPPVTVLFSNPSGVLAAKDVAVVQEMVHEVRRKEHQRMGAIRSRQFLAVLGRLGADINPSRGKGGHCMVHYREKSAPIVNNSAELGGALVRKLLGQLGIDENDFLKAL